MSSELSRQLDYTLDGSGRVSAVALHGSTSYASSITYASHGAVSGMTLGNTLVETTTFNTRLQPVTIAAGSLLTLGYDYGTNNNGNVRSQTITRVSLNRSQSYGYDAANRLTCVNEFSGTTPTACGGGGSPLWTEAHGYDAAGNHWVTSTGISEDLSAPVSGTQYDAATNRIKKQSISGLPDMPTDAYDAAGNLRNHPQIGQFTYDAENRQTSATAGSTVTYYVYDGEGRRVAKIAAGTTYYMYDGMGQLATEFPSVPPAATATKYLTADALGTTRLVTDASAAVVECADYLPFGQKVPANSVTGRTAACFTGSDPAPEKVFTGKERDSESGLDYFGARYLSSAQGRWTSPDWSAIQQPVPYANLQDPQTLNLYAYVRNNPLSMVDPDGHNLWDKFKNIFTDAECFCEGDEAAARKALKKYRHEQVTKHLSGTQEQQFSEVVTSEVFFGVEGAAIDVAGAGNAVADAHEASEGTALMMINGRLPINSGLAGGTHPTGVPFTTAGFPDFSSYAVAEVQLNGLTGNNTKDAAMANQAAGLSRTPAGYTWHHVEDGKTMQLVPTSIHQPVGHTGGAAVIRYGTDKW